MQNYVLNDADDYKFTTLENASRLVTEADSMQALGPMLRTNSLTGFIRGVALVGNHPSF